MLDDQLADFIFMRFRLSRAEGPPAAAPQSKAPPDNSRSRRLINIRLLPCIASHAASFNDILSQSQRAGQIGVAGKLWCDDLAR